MTLSLWSFFGPIVTLVFEPSTHPVLFTVRVGSRLGHFPRGEQVVGPEDSDPGDHGGSWEQEKRAGRGLPHPASGRKEDSPCRADHHNRSLHTFRGTPYPLLQIGRASCRERV